MNRVHLLVYTVVGGLPSTSAACCALNNQYISMTLIKNRQQNMLSHPPTTYTQIYELNEIPNKS